MEYSKGFHCTLSKLPWLKKDQDFSKENTRKVHVSQTVLQDLQIAG